MAGMRSVSIFPDVAYPRSYNKSDLELFYENVERANRAMWDAYVEVSREIDNEQCRRDQTHRGAGASPENT